MKQNMVETILGGVVLIIAITFFIYGTGKANVAGASGGYVVRAQFTDIGALAVGDDVKISGVPIGKIVAVDLDDAVYTADVKLMINPDVKLPYDTSARISSEGLLGGTYMALDVGGDTETLVDGDMIVITQSAQNLEQLLGQFIFSMQDNNTSE